MFYYFGKSRFKNMNKFSVFFSLLVAFMELRFITIYNKKKEFIS